MKNKTEIKSFDFVVQANESEEHGHSLTGRAIVFDQPAELFSPRIGNYQEFIDRDALQNTDLRDVRFLINHNTDMIPLARSRRNNENSTMQMIVTDGGLDIRVDLDVENNADARSLYSAVSRGDISGMSFMMIVDEDKWDDANAEMPTRHIRSISKVLEVSAVTFPAYAQTSISTRGLSDALDSAADSLESERARLAEIERRKQKIRILSEV